MGQKTPYLLIEGAGFALGGAAAPTDFSGAAGSGALAVQAHKFFPKL
jgi:hypothetical protein